MAKRLDLNKTVYELTQEYPELIDIMAGLGFKEITKKPMLLSVGKIMTIPRGAKMKNIPMMDVVTTLVRQGFELSGEIPDLTSAGGSEKEMPAGGGAPASRTEQLKAYLKRLGDGEELEDVRADFVREFGEVEASEIMRAEQELLQEGTPLSEVQRLCDVHSALFHGATREEKIANAEKEVEASLERQKALKETGIREQEKAAQAPSAGKDYTDKNVRAARLAAVKGHPLGTLVKENEAFADLLAKLRKTRDESLLPAIRELTVHYAKKGDLLYPLLKVRYGVTGPAEVMWTVDDEIRDELGALAKESVHDEKWNSRLDAALTRAEEMVYKEQNILFPICAVNFTEEDWQGIYRDAKDYAVCFGVEPETWEDAEKQPVLQGAVSDGEVVMPGGHLTVEQLTALLNTIPMEISFVDAGNINRFFNEGPKVFKRPAAAIDREVFSCHPPKIEPMVRQIIDDFRNNRRDAVPVWMEKGGRTMLVKYMAVRDGAGKYLGTVELVQDMEFAREHFLEKQA
ncbi:MAG: DUF438 domain-containing protein [Lachnospiraceae bacterium]|nr:DUF438 domain-containing protein [Lachnospiraceae bacterium]MCI1327785.1 DUF438 domain-containing protein [Lachnospiraceae bacterium]